MNNVVLEKSRRFGFRIVKMSKYLCAEENEYVLSKQILRSGTSIGANITEAQFAVSKKEFSLKCILHIKSAEKPYIGLICSKAVTILRKKCTIQ